MLRHTIYRLSTIRSLRYITTVTSIQSSIQSPLVGPHDVTKIQTTKLSILLRFYFHGVLEQLKTNFQTNFRFKRVLGFVIEYA